MAQLINLETGIRISRFVNCSIKRKENLTIQTSLDGTEYLTMFGKAVLHYEMEIFIDRVGKKLLLEAADTLSLLQYSGAEGIVTGRIVKLSPFKNVTTTWSSAKIELASESEVSPA